MKVHLSKIPPGDIQAPQMAELAFPPCWAPHLTHHNSQLTGQSQAVPLCFPGWDEGRPGLDFVRVKTLFLLVCLPGHLPLAFSGLKRTKPSKLCRLLPPPACLLVSAAES